MPTKKKFKKVVRALSDRTGKSYQASLQAIEPAPSPEPASKIPLDLKKQIIEKYLGAPETRVPLLMSFHHPIRDSIDRLNSVEAESPAWLEAVQHLRDQSATLAAVLPHCSKNEAPYNGAYELCLEAEAKLRTLPVRTEPSPDVVELVEFIHEMKNAVRVLDAPRAILHICFALTPGDLEPRFTTDNNVLFVKEPWTTSPQPDTKTYRFVFSQSFRSKLLRARDSILKREPIEGCRYLSPHDNQPEVLTDLPVGFVWEDAHGKPCTMPTDSEDVIRGYPVKDFFDAWPEETEILPNIRGIFKTFEMTEHHRAAFAVLRLYFWAKSPV